MKKELFINQKYLLIPINLTGIPTIVSLFDGGNKIYEFVIPIIESTSSYKADYYAPLPVSAWNQKALCIEGSVTTAFINAVHLTNTIPESTLLRPAIHFTPTSGWVNDPNGLIYKDGLYHLFFQHNPFHVEWGNMSWGHAVSTDLLHWKQLDTVMFPDSDGTIFSGCAILNEHGLLSLPPDALLFFYTCAGNTSNWSKYKSFVQKIAYSLDNGNTLSKLEGCTLEHITGENRDPKVYWHPQSSVYYMVLYLDKNDFAIFNSKDLNSWKMTQRLSLPDAWECPDLREIPITGGGTKWMLWTADGFYYLGEFDGHTFETDGIRHEAYATKLPYAAQTFYGTDRIISIPWLRTSNSKNNYRGVMGLPRQLDLIEKNGEYLLRQKLIDELEIQKRLLCENTSSFYHEGNHPYEIVLEPNDNTPFSLNIGTTTCLFNGRILKLNNLDKIYELPLHNAFHKISLLFDYNILEITVDDGLLCAVYELENVSVDGIIQIDVADTSKCDVRVYEL